MSKNLKILIALLAVIAVLFLYLVLTSRPLDGNIELEANNQSEEINTRLVNDYKNNANKILASYWQLSRDKEISIEECGYLKDRLLELKVPSDFKELHLNLVMAFDKLEDYLENGGEKEKAESKRIIEQAMADYEWLRE
jgi:uncharacterized protein YpmS